MIHHPLTKKMPASWASERIVLSTKGTQKCLLGASTPACAQICQELFHLAMQFCTLLVRWLWTWHPRAHKETLNNTYVYQHVAATIGSVPYCASSCPHFQCCVWVCCIQTVIKIVTVLFFKNRVLHLLLPWTLCTVKIFRSHLDTYKLHPTFSKIRWCLVVLVPSCRSKTMGWGDPAWLM